PARSGRVASVSEVTVKSCSASWTARANERGGDLQGGRGSWKARCGSDLAESLGLSDEETTVFEAVFGRGAVTCSGRDRFYSGCFRGDTAVATETGPRPIENIAVSESGILVHNK
ncbi:MAG: hypothetical protein VCC02_01050, partial [Myxococcota bacterium]